MLYIPNMKTMCIAGLDGLAALVSDHVNQAAKRIEGELRIGIPGGRSAAPLMKGLLSASPEVLSRVRLYLVDERASGDRNYNTLMAVGLGEALEKGFLRSDQVVVPRLGETFLPDGATLALLYLGVGEDGHFASLFPGSYPDLDAKSVPEITFVSDSPKPPAARVTVTYRALRLAARQAKVYLLFLGEGKHQALERLLADKESPATLPCLFFPREWFNVDIITDIKERLP